MKMTEVVLWVPERRVFWAEETARAKARRQRGPDGRGEQKGGSVAGEKWGKGNW